ncbi:NAD(P)/FAD-dependent oxidoreductase [Amycolatopsis sp. 3B14]|uniref:NAD(P)/FAD-dependent oxidoreductase n=1 Tax=Amycolatopsis sp. 3B14 TaxID=3243600 RepID=UPI003D97272D
MRSPTVVVGGSVAGVRTVQALRARGYEEDIVLVDQEPGPPYDKPALSKEILTGAAAQPPALADLGGLAVDHRPGLAATGLDLAARRLVTGSGSIPFGRLVIATGSRPRRLPALDSWAGVHYLRTRADAASLRAEFTGRPRVVVVGGGFVGGEVASSARALGLDVTIVEAAPRLLARLMPPEVSDRVARLHRDHGVHVRCGRTVTGCRGRDRVEAVELDDGTRLDADVVVAGIGTTPATRWLTGSGLVLDDGVRCGPDLSAHGADGVWAIGDCARWFDVVRRRPVRMEHWTAAREQASFVAGVIVGDAPAAAFSTTGYVWSDQHGVRIQHVGRVDAATTTSSIPTGGGQLFLHHDGDELVGATAFDAPRDLLAFRRRVASAAAPLTERTRG